MKNKLLKFIKTTLLVVIPILVVFFVYRAAGLRRINLFLAGAVDPAAYHEAIELLNSTLVNFEFGYLNYRELHSDAQPATGDIVAFDAGEDNPAQLLFNDWLDFSITVPETGLYNIYVRYKIPGETILPVTVSLYINDDVPFAESRTLDLPLIFRDEHKDYELDRHGDEMLPAQIRMMDWRGQRLHDSNYISYLPLQYFLEAGQHDISIRNIVRSEVWISDVIFKPALVLPSHDEYIAEMVALHGIPYETGEPFFKAITSNLYAYTISSDLAVGTWNDPSFGRHSNRYRYINFVFWYLFGSEVIFEVEIEEAGFYSLGFHYINSYEEVSHFHAIKVNGYIPSAPFAVAEARATGIGLGNMEITDDEGNPLRVFLHEGVNTIAIGGVRGPFAPVINDLQTLLIHIGEFILDIRKITGAEVDTNRTWRLTRYLPNTEAFLEAYQVIIEESIRRIAPYTLSELNSDVAATLMDAVAQLRFLQEFPDELPLRLEALAGEAGSVMDYISYAVGYLLMPAMALSQVFVYNDYELPPPNISFPRRVASISEQILLSFTSDRFRHVPEPDAVNVWVALSPMHMNTLQAMINRDFTLNTGIEVRISLMPDMNRLILANASGDTPDIAMGLPAGTVFNLSSRNALYDLSEQPDFWEVASRFPPGALVSYVFNDGVFAIPDQVNFNALVYRTDVFQALGLDPPDTWQDVIDILPELQRFGMEFFHPIAIVDGHKGFGLTTPMIYQHGGSLYSPDGLTAAITSPESIAGIRFLSSLFTYHALPVQVPSFFNSFRMSLVPVGIADAMTYNLIRNGAPELEGLWALAPNPGMPDANGDVSRWFVTESFSGMIIFDDSEHKDEAWQFLSWWTSAPVQAQFASTMQTLYGRQFMWFSSNMEALAQNPIDPDDLGIILEQVEWLRTVPFTPGFYEMERSLSNIWNTIVFDGTAPRNAVDSMIPGLNRELSRKMREVGFTDAAGNLTVDYTIREIDWIIEMIERYGGVR